MVVGTLVAGIKIKGDSVPSVGTNGALVDFGVGKIKEEDAVVGVVVTEAWVRVGVVMTGANVNRGKVGFLVGFSVGIGSSVIALVGGLVGAFAGFLVGALVGFLVGVLVGAVVGFLFDGALVGALVGFLVGALVGARIGTFVGFLVGGSVSNGGPTPPMENSMILPNPEKSYIRMPDGFPVRRDFVLGYPESESSDLEPPSFHKSRSSPKFTLFSRSSFPSACTTETTASSLLTTL